MIILLYVLKHMENLQEVQEFIRKSGSDIINLSYQDKHAVKDTKKICRELVIVLFVSVECKYCLEALKEIERLGLGDVIKIYDISTQEGLYSYKKICTMANKDTKDVVVPLWISLVTNKYTTGIKSADKIISELSR